MELRAFYEHCQSLPENDRRWVNTFYEDIIKIFGEEHQTFENIEKVCRLFYGISSSLSKAQYYRKRKLVWELYKWLETQNAVSHEFAQKVYHLQLKNVVLNTELLRCYFKDLDEALDFVSFVGSMNGMGSYDDLLNIKSIVILIWNQVTVEELCELHKSSLVSELTSVSLRDKTIYLDQKYFNILKRFSELDLHKGFPSQKMQIYLNSPYLIRSAKKIKLCKNNITKVILRFNAVSAKYGKEFSILNLRRNGIFSKIYTSRRDDTANTLIQELIGCDTSFAFGYKEIYEEWKRLLIGGD